MADDQRALPRLAPGPLITDPTWYRDAVIYQVHVKSFHDANNDGIGDFRGLIAKLDYIASLGVDTIWVLPFYPSPLRDDGYDIAEYRAVHPDYGTMRDAREFIEQAHRRGLRVITELVINHTSDQHPWFQRARRAKPGSAARDFYVWSDTDQKYADTRVIFCSTENSNWTWDPVAGAYYWHRFFSHQPDLNFDNPQVLKAVIAVMRFWLAMGVDGLRLDAIPYLCEREGTHNENLPETHAILKQMRAIIDAEFPHRMLLAEANMWPEDCAGYFGDGDECQMAFHFPLMPRMYMAIAQEDRFPIVDAMRQTPDIPDTCQWAIFLRNHDELTLEYVTDNERDYLWDVYASETRARLNQGIRRRLAPLMERDRRRIELMDSLLLSMPGTPVMYYGDEIGMGDNIHLGDRDGVRTPMQWSPDRNGGFSRADPERLILPAVQGTLYGYEAVNVEAQSRDPHSLLNWTRRMLGVRQRHRAFGRGGIRFLRPANRKVLAYLRSHEGETLLCVANLSRTAQAVELGLAEFAGLTPVELLGGAAFPPIGQLSYLLTLPPYGFYWFVLRRDADLHEPDTRPPESMSELVTLVIRSSPLEILHNSRSRALIESEILPVYLPIRRWFAPQGHTIRATRVVYLQPLPETTTALGEVEVTYEDSSRERYLLPVGVVWDSATLPALPQQVALARIRQREHLGFLTDALSIDAFAVGVLVSLRQSTTLEGHDGRIEFRPEPGANIPTSADLPVHLLATERAHSVLNVGDTAVIKLTRRVWSGTHPEAQMLRHLTRKGCACIPPLLGEVVRRSPDGVDQTLMVISGYIYNEGTAWRWATDYLLRALDNAAAVEADPELMRQSVESFAHYLGIIGQRLAEVHAILAQPDDDADFAPEPVDADIEQRWRRDASDAVEQALQLVDATTAWPDEATERDAADLLRHAGELRRVLRQPLTFSGPALRTRVHGEFHLGEVLVSRGDCAFIDFEGKPHQGLEERRQKASPLIDVAGLLRSLDYVSAAVLNKPTTAPQTLLLDRHVEAARKAFRMRYRDVAKQQPHAAFDPDDEQAMLKLFLIRTAAREILAEAATRPSWIGIPLRGLLRLIEAGGE